MFLEVNFKILYFKVNNFKIKFYFNKMNYFIKKLKYFN